VFIIIEISTNACTLYSVHIGGVGRGGGANATYCRDNAAGKLYLSQYSVNSFASNRTSAVSYVNYLSMNMDANMETGLLVY